MVRFLKKGPEEAIYPRLQRRRKMRGTGRKMMTMMELVRKKRGGGGNLGDDFFNGAPGPDQPVPAVLGGEWWRFGVKRQRRGCTLLDVRKSYAQ